ncbi:cupredoxin domain-containing protein [Thalassomonas viridans]|uniref:Cupredoxin domain-containing protein n=1 Tax=Thalassomonas viridans TaxID=137584 RepID=A0AAF0C9I1_9GAMM|nr:plastocyanin/azurin family copper-binding protein [Thalassomonas viridans]WDE05788.1 cupredoxin domain-containing protein [Thalassomonas viridans]
MRVITALAALGLLLLSSPGSAKQVEVEIYKMQFIPQQVVIAPGDTVIWRNKEKRQYHNVWFKQFTQEEPDYFFPGETFEQHFDKAGTYPYVCGPHPKMTGTVIVKAG